MDYINLRLSHTIYIYVGACALDFLLQSVKATNSESVQNTGNHYVVRPKAALRPISV